MGILRPDQVLKNIVPVIMSGILGIYGVVVAVLLSGGREYYRRFFCFDIICVNIVTDPCKRYHLPFTIVSYKQTLYSGFIQFAAGLSVGLSGLGAGIAIGITGEAGVRATAQQPKMFVGMVSIYTLRN